MMGNMWKIVCQGRKKEQRFLFVSQFFCSMLLAIAFLITGSIQKSGEEARFRIYGQYRGAVYKTTSEMESRLRDHAAVTRCGTMKVLAALKNENKTVGYAGTMDSEMRSLGKIRLKEGKFPETSGEIAAETSLLAVLGIPLQTGRECEFVWETVDPDTGKPRTEKRIYKLCGILESSTDLWDSGGNALCNALVSPDGQEKAIWTNVFFDSIHRNGKEMQELETLIPPGSGAQLIYNSYAYPEGRGLSWYMEQGLFLLLAFLLALFFVFLTQIILFQRKQYRCRVLRLLGADKRMLCQLWILESVRVWAPAFVLGSFAGTVFLQGCFYLWKQFYHVQIHIYMHVFLYLASAAASLAAVLSGSLYPILLMGRVPAVPAGKDLTRYQVRHLRQNRGTVLSWKEFYRRESGLCRKQNLYEGIFLFLAMVQMLSGFFITFEKYRNYVIKKALVCQDYEWTAQYPSGLSQEQIDKIQKTESISGIDRYTIVDSQGTTPLWVCYEGWEEDAYFHLEKWNSMETEEENCGMTGRLVMLPKGSGLLSYYTAQETFDLTEEEFEAGEKAVVYLPDVLVDEEGEISYLGNLGASTYKAAGKKTGTALQAGQELQIRLGSKESRILCAGVLKRFHHYFQENRDFLLPGDVLVSQKFLEQFLEKKVTAYNYVMAYGNGDSTYEITDKRMSGISTDSRVVFRIYREEKEQMKEDFLRTFFLVGIFTFFLFAVSVLICCHNRAGRMQQERQRLWLFRYLGMDTWKMLRLHFLPFLEKTVILTVLANFLLFPLFMKSISRITGDGYTSFRDYVRMVFRMGVIGFPWKWYLGLQAAFAGFLLLSLLKMLWPRVHERRMDAF